MTDEAQLRATIQVLRQDGPSLELAQALRNLGEAERGIAGSDGGVASYEEAIALFRQENVPLKLAHTIRHLGDIHRHNGDLERSNACYREALALYRAHAEAPLLDVANALRGMALLQEKFGADSKELWQEAKRLYAAAGVVITER